MGELLRSSETILFTLPWPKRPELIEHLQKKFPDAEVIYEFVEWKRSKSGDRPAQVPDELYRRATVLVTLFSLPSSPDVCPDLKFVQMTSAGSDKIVQSRLFRESEIAFATASGVHGPQISEWFLMTLLTFSHSYNAMYESQKQRNWDSSKGANVRDLTGQRLGVLGYGSIGRQAANVARAMGMDVIAYTSSPRDTPEKRKDDGFIVPGTGDPDGSVPSKWFSGTDKASLHKFLNQDIDALLVSVPLTPATRHMLSTEEFAVMSKRKTFISNIARGPIIDSKALQTALEEGQIRGAALDVTDPEPLPEDHPLWTAPNVTITPHVSGYTDKYTDRVFQLLEVNLERIAKGEKAINEIDRKRGY